MTSKLIRYLEVNYSEYEIVRWFIGGTWRNFTIGLNRSSFDCWIRNVVSAPYAIRMNDMEVYKERFK